MKKTYISPMIETDDLCSDNFCLDIIAGSNGNAVKTGGDNGDGLAKERNNFELEQFNDWGSL